MAAGKPKREKWPRIILLVPATDRTCPPRRIYSFGVQKASASDHLFTFLLHDGMEPTNKSVEREMRYPVIHRKIRDQIGSTEKMARFGILLTCILTWRKQKLNFYREMDRILLIHA